MSNEDWYKIKERPALGPGGWIDYFETEARLSFGWEYIINGFSIRIPLNEEWGAFCEREDAMWAIDRREIIIKRIIEEMRKRYKTDDVTLDDYWITVHFGPLLNIRGFLRRLKILK